MTVLLILIATLTAGAGTVIAAVRRAYDVALVGVGAFCLALLFILPRLGVG